MTHLCPATLVIVIRCWSCSVASFCVPFSSRLAHNFWENFRKVCFSFTRFIYLHFSKAISIVFNDITVLPGTAAVSDAVLAHFSVFFASYPAIKLMFLMRFKWLYEPNILVTDVSFFFCVRLNFFCPLHESQAKNCSSKTWRKCRSSQQRDI